MNEARLNYLFQAYFNKVATSTERDELMELMAKAENDESLNALLTETWQQFNSQHKHFNDSQGEKMFAAILKKQTAARRGNTVHTYKRTFIHLAIAAAVMLFAVTGLYYWLNTRQPDTHPIVNNKATPGTIKPGGNKAMLTLSDGSSIVLDSMHVGILLEQGNAKDLNLSSATLAYNVVKGNKTAVVYNTVSTSGGGQYQVILSDGTRVWLNASSSIRFPTVFEGNERNVSITGEVYFEVASKTDMVFNITTGDMNVQVLGTSFDIMAYDDENSVNTTLLEGKVKVSRGVVDKILVPGQQSRISNNAFKIVEADMEEVMAWKNGWFYFNAYDIKKMMRQIQRWYDVEIEYEGAIPGGHFSGSVSRGNNILQVLKIMEAGGVGFKIEGKKVIVRSN